MNDNTNQQQTTPTPEETGGRTFTQEEVNAIVSDRLAREARAVKNQAVRAYYTVSIINANPQAEKVETWVDIPGCGSH